MSIKYKAMVLSCIDPRFQSKVFNYLKKRKLGGKYSSFTIAGAAVGITNKNFKKWNKTFIENLSTSIQLHKINRLIVINHQDCGAAKMMNSKKYFNNRIETKIHKKSFMLIKNKFKQKYASLSIETILISLNKKVKKF